MFLTEHRPTLTRAGKPKFVPTDILHTYRGFRGVYAFSPHHAQEIEARGHMRDLQDIPVYSDTLLLDYDNNPEDAAKFKLFLVNNEIAFEELDSGNRSVHFHVEIQPMLGKDVPYQQKQWVKEHAPGADTSFYHKCGIYRLTGTYHVKNPGHHKHITDVRTGNKLLIRVAPEKLVRRSVAHSSVDADQLFRNMLRKDVQEGDRIPYLFKLMKIAQEAGYGIHDFNEEVQWWNDNKCNPPHENRYLEQWLGRTWK